MKESNYQHSENARVSFCLLKFSTVFLVDQFRAFKFCIVLSKLRLFLKVKYTRKKSIPNWCNTPGTRTALQSEIRAYLMLNFSRLHTAAQALQASAERYRKLVPQLRGINFRIHFNCEMLFLKLLFSPKALTYISSTCCRSIAKKKRWQGVGPPSPPFLNGLTFSPPFCNRYCLIEFYSRSYFC